MADRKRKQSSAESSLSSSCTSCYYDQEQLIQQQEYLYRKRTHHHLLGFNKTTIITPLQSASSSNPLPEYYRNRNIDVLRGFNNIITPEISSSCNQLPQEKGPLGLRLSLSASDVNKLLQKQLLLPQNHNTPTQQQQIINKQPQQPQQPHHHKMKVANIPAVSLEIGNWKRKSELHVVDLTAKFYYGRKQLLWEFLDGNLKKKIQIGWSQISAINSSYLHQNKTTRLQIQLKEPPKLYEEVNFEVQKHTSWAIPNDDFTNGQASICMHHTIVFRGRELDDAYMKLLQSDNRLLGLSQQPFQSRYPTGFKNPRILDFSCNEIIGGCSSIVPYSHNLADAQGLKYWSSVLKMSENLNQNPKVDDKAARGKQIIRSSNYSEEIPNVILNTPTKEINLLDDNDPDVQELAALLEDVIPVLRTTNQEET